MSNLVKAGYAVREDERVIDYNELIKEKVQAVLDMSQNSGVNPDSFIDGLDVSRVDGLVGDGDDFIGLSPDQLAAMTENQGDEPVDTEELARQRLESAKEESQQIVDDARLEAENMLNSAKEEAGQILEDAKNEGYAAGIQAAEQEIEDLKAQLMNQEEDTLRQLEQDYEEKKKTLEPDLVEVLCNVFERFTQAEANGDKSILLHLINSALEDADKSDEYIIRVSSADYDFMVNNQGKVYMGVDRDLNLDIVEDNSLGQNECIIETDGGVFNCGLDIELNNLIKKIKLLSCME